MFNQSGVATYSLHPSMQSIKVPRTTQRDGGRMYQKICFRGLLIIAACLCASTAAMAAVTVVYPTGQWPDDVSNVQAAVDAGGQVLLKAVNRAGAATAFNFGTPEYLPGRRVILDTAVDLTGEQRGQVRTTIRGGLAPVRGIAPVRRALRNLDFVGNLLAAIEVFGSADRLEISGVHVRGTIPLPGQPGGFPLSQVQGIFISGYSTGNVSGAIVLHDNQIDLSNVSADFQWAVQLDTVYGTVQIHSNSILIGQAPGGSRDSEALALVRCHGSVSVTGNSIDIGVNAYVGINGYGGPDANFRISENFLRVAGPYADGIDMIGVSTGASANGGVAQGEVSDNIILLQNAWSGISLYGLVSGVRVNDNTIEGQAYYGIGASYFIGNDQVTANRFHDNNVRALATTLADVFLDGNTSANVVRDSCRTFLDLGTGNSVKCEQ